MMKFEVDQSGRIEETNRHTVIAIANKNFEFRFTNIGKKSPAHHSAYSTFKKKNKANYIIEIKELEKIMLNMKP